MIMAKRTGFILSVGDIEKAWQIEHDIKAEGHTNMSGFGFLRPDTEVASHGLVGKEPARNLMISLDKLKPGGGIKEHYHEYGPTMPIFDHAYYVVSGRIKAIVGDEEKTVGADSLVYCPSNVKHSILNVGKRTARVLRVTGSDEGKIMGGWADEEKQPPAKKGGFILPIQEIEKAWRIEHAAEAEGHHNMQGYSFLTVPSEAALHGMVGKELATNLMLGLDKFPSGGGIMEHTHVTNKEFPVFDHAYYVISGQIQGTVGDTVKTVGPDSLIYCPSDVKHAILNVGDTTAKVLRIAGCDKGAKMGGWDKK
jgi:quercetin dioxygenase-like cupin family protein